MSDQPDSPEPEPSPDELLAAARERWAQATRFLPPGAEPMLPPHFQVTAGMNALAHLLLEHGVIDKDEYVAAKTVAMAELQDQITASFTELKRKAMGLQVVENDRPL